MTLTLCLRDDPVERRIDATELGRKLFEYLLARGQQAVKALAALVLFAPLALQESLAFKAPQQGVERPLVDLEAGLFQRFAKRVAVPLRPKLRAALFR